MISEQPARESAPAREHGIAEDQPGPPDPAEGRSEEHKAPGEPGARPGGEGREGGRGRRDRGDRGERGDREGGRRPGDRRVKRPRRRVCTFCVDKITHIDYKDHARLREFISDRGKILKSRLTGACARHQRALSRAIKRARQIALLPFTTE